MPHLLKSFFRAGVAILTGVPPGAFPLWRPTRAPICTTATPCTPPRVARRVERAVIIAPILDTPTPRLTSSTRGLGNAGALTKFSSGALQLTRPFTGGGLFPDKESSSLGLVFPEEKTICPVQENREEKQMPLFRIGNQLSIVLGFLFIGSAMSATAHVGSIVVPFAEVTDEMLSEIQLDGSVEEWSDLIGEPAMTLLDFEPERKEAGALDPSDIDFQIWLAWHDEPARLYVAFVAADDRYWNTHTYDVEWETSL